LVFGFGVQEIEGRRKRREEKNGCFFCFFLGILEMCFGLFEVAGPPPKEWVGFDHPHTDCRWSHPLDCIGAAATPLIFFFYFLIVLVF
jgi:hypothetical protein